MNKIILLLFLTCSQLVLAQTPSYKWAKALGASTNSVVLPQGMATDKFDNIFTTGVFSDTVDFDPGPGVQQLVVGTFANLFVTKLDKNGNYKWAKQIGENKGAQGEDICTDSSGNCIVIGNLTDTIDSDPGPGVAKLNCPPSTCLAHSMIIKLDSLGNFMWSKQLEVNSTDSMHYVFALNVMSDKRENIVISGYFNGTIDFDPGAGTVLKSNLVGASLFILTLDKYGNFKHIKTIGNVNLPDVIYSFAIAHDKYNNVMLTGSFTGEMDFDPGPGVFFMTSYGNRSAFTLCLDSFGDFRWANYIGPDAANGSWFSNFGFAVATDLSGNTYVTGAIEDTVELDGINNLLPIRCKGPNDAYIVKYDTHGKVLWGNTFGADGYDEGKGVAVDKSGNVLGTGYFTYTVDFDPSSGIDTLVALLGGNDAYVVQFDSSGNLKWNLNLQGDGATNMPINIFTNILSGFYVGGSFAGSVDFDASAGVANMSPTNNVPFVCKYTKESIAEAIINHSNLEDFDVYPNPTSGLFQIRNVPPTSVLKLGIWNVFGQKIEDSYYRDGDYIDISSTASGIYYVQIISEEKQTMSKKIFKY
jgi:Secretion system C-terminal sorting domain